MCTHYSWLVLQGSSRTPILAAVFAKQGACYPRPARASATRGTTCLTLLVYCGLVCFMTTFCRVKDHHYLLHYSQLVKSTCGSFARQEEFDWPTCFLTGKTTFSATGRVGCPGRGRLRRRPRPGRVQFSAPAKRALGPAGTQSFSRRQF